MFLVLKGSEGFRTPQGRFWKVLKGSEGSEGSERFRKVPPPRAGQVWYGFCTCPGHAHIAHLWLGCQAGKSTAIRRERLASLGVMEAQLRVPLKHPGPS